MASTVDNLQSHSAIFRLTYLPKFSGKIELLPLDRNGLDQVEVSKRDVMKYIDIFAEKNVSSITKATLIFAKKKKKKKINVFENSYNSKRVCHKGLVKLTMLWKTGPWFTFSCGSVASSDSRYLLCTTPNT